MLLLVGEAAAMVVRWSYRRYTVLLLCLEVVPFGAEVRVKVGRPRAASSSLVLPEPASSRSRSDQTGNVRPVRRMW